MKNPISAFFLNNPSWLRHRYVDLRQSTYDLAKVLRCDPKTVHGRLVKFGIPTRRRGENLQGSDNYMSTPGVINPFQGKTHKKETIKRLRRMAVGPKPGLRGPRNGMYKVTGPVNPNYVDGSSPDRLKAYSMSKWRLISRCVYNRDGYRCVRCKSPRTGPKSLHIHHIRPWAMDKELRFAVDNLVVLCRTCHQWVHSNDNSKREFLC